MWGVGEAGGEGVLLEIFCLLLFFRGRRQGGGLFSDTHTEVLGTWGDSSR